MPRGLANGFAALTLAAGIGAFLWRRSRQTPGEVAMGLISDALINQIRDIAQIEPGPSLRAHVHHLQPKPDHNSAPVTDV